MALFAIAFAPFFLPSYIRKSQGIDPNLAGN